jgi:hypothetical protein
MMGKLTSALATDVRIIAALHPELPSCNARGLNISGNIKAAGFV